MSGNTKPSPARTPRPPCAKSARSMPNLYGLKLSMCPNQTTQLGQVSHRHGLSFQYLGDPAQKCQIEIAHGCDYTCVRATVDIIFSRSCCIIVDHAGHTLRAMQLTSHLGLYMGNPTLMSRPRAATSVAHRIGLCPLLNASADVETQ